VKEITTYVGVDAHYDLTGIMRTDSGADWHSGRGDGLLAARLIRELYT
jgi:hypothetical protein